MAKLVDDVAYFRERWSITSDAPLGLEAVTGPGGNDRHRYTLQHRLDETAVDTLSTLAAKRDGTLAAVASADEIGAAMEERRDLIVSLIENADRPPEWAEDLLESSTWSKEQLAPSTGTRHHLPRRRVPGPLRHSGRQRRRSAAG